VRLSRALRSAGAGLAALALLALPATAPAAVGPPYSLSVTAPGVLQAVPAAGSSTLAVRVTYSAGAVTFTPAAASAPGGAGQCTSTLLTTTCGGALIDNELSLQGSVLDADVQLHGKSTGIVRLTGGPGSDSMVVDGSALPDTNSIGQVVLTPGTGNDAVTIGGNVNAISLAAPDPGGDDRYVVDSAGASIGGTLQLGDGNDFASSRASNLTLDGGAGDDRLSGAGPLLGGTGSDVLQPTAPGQPAAGGDGPGDIDLLSYDQFGPPAPAAPSPLQLGKPTATDVLLAGDPVMKTGIEQLAGGRGNDTLGGTGAQDVLLGGDGDDVLDGRGGGDVLDGGPGNNTVSYEFGPTPVTVDLGAGTGGAAPLDTLRGFERVVTGPGNDVVTGTTADEAFVLGGGDDSLNAGPGNDAVDAGPGNDLLRGGPGSDVLDGGAGSDTATYDERGPSEPLNVSLATLGGDGAAGENDSLPGIENVIGGASNDTLSGDGAANLLVGGPGLNVLDGGAGDDEIQGGDNRDVITGGAGNDRLFGAGDDDSINAFDVGKPDADVVDCGTSLDDDAQVDASDQVTGCEYSRRADVPVPVDDDQDGFVGGFDCNDHNAAINQGATDIPGDGIDQDCDGFDTQIPFVDYGLSLTASAPKAKKARGITFKRFVITRIASDRRVDVTCKSGKGKTGKCPFKKATRRPAARKSEVSLTSLFKGRLLAPGAVVEFRVTAPKLNGRVRRFTIGSLSARSQELCLIGPSTKPKKCPAGDEL
jgi:Ca2+-binding RTX toxin-like protein